MMSGGRRAKIRPPKHVSTHPQCIDPAHFDYAYTSLQSSNKDLSTAVDFDSSWTKLSGAIMEIHHKNASKLSFEELYRTAYALVLRKFGKRLYDAVNNEIRNYLLTSVVTRLSHLIASETKKPRPNTVEILRSVRKSFDDHTLCMRMISDILMYLDRAYSKEAGAPLIYDAGLALFRDVVIRNNSTPVGEPLYDLIIAEIQRERSGENIDRLAIKPVINMLEAFPNHKLEGESLYAVEFEPRFQTATEKFFSEAATRLLEANRDASAYLHKVRDWLEEETNRCTIYLAPSTLGISIPCVEKVLLTNRIETVLKLDTGFIYWMENDKLDDLKLAYDLISLISDPTDQKICMKVIHDLLHDKVMTDGREINQRAITASEDIKAARASGVKDKSLLLNPTAVSIEWVEQVLTLKQKNDKILKTCFANNIEVQTSMEDAFAKFINENRRVAEFLSLFIDDHLKKSIKGKTEEEVEEVLERTIILFRFIADKDLFENYYKAHLSKRLLNGKSLSDDVERNLIARIRMEMGAAFTNKLEGMFRDMKLSRDQMVDFRNRRQAGDIDIAVDINVNVLTMTYWPTAIVSAQTKCLFPAEVEKAREEFEKFYLSRHNGRVMAWNPSMGTADVRATFKKRTHEINMPTIAMVILMLFNDVPPGGSLTYGEIQNATNLPDGELSRHLQSIAVAPRTRLLRKDPLSRDIKPTDRFSINEKFESPMTRIKVLAVSSSNKAENESERKETLEKLDKARKYETDAAIVRTMK